MISKVSYFKTKNVNNPNKCKIKQFKLLKRMNVIFNKHVLITSLLISCYQGDIHNHKILFVKHNSYQNYDQNICNFIYHNPRFIESRKFSLFFLEKKSH